MAASAAAPREKLQIAPRLRLEPCPSYYLRTARGYAFLATFLETSLAGDTLATLHGLREGNPPEREADLRAELRGIRDLFYGFYLLSAEDIGLKPQFLEGEDINREQCESLAARWLASFANDPDLAPTPASRFLFMSIPSGTSRGSGRPSASGSRD